MHQFELPPPPLRSLVASLNVLLRQTIEDDAVRCAIIAKRLVKLLRPGWLPAAALLAGREGYQRHVLYEDPAGSFSIGSFVWLPGQQTPIHDHTCWGVIGILSGRLMSENFTPDGDGGLRHASSIVLPAGYTTWLSPAQGDIHRIANRAARTQAVSIHVYGASFSEVCRERYDDALAVAGDPLGNDRGSDFSHG